MQNKNMSFHGVCRKSDTENFSSTRQFFQKIFKEKSPDRAFTLLSNTSRPWEESYNSEAADLDNKSGVQLLLDLAIRASLTWHDDGDDAN